MKKNSSATINCVLAECTAYFNLGTVWFAATQDIISTILVLLLIQLVQLCAVHNEIDNECRSD